MPSANCSNKVSSRYWQKLDWDQQTYLYQTTQEFLVRFSLNSLDERSPLPAFSEEPTPVIQDEELNFISKQIGFVLSTSELLEFGTQDPRLLEQLQTGYPKHPRLRLGFKNQAL